MLERNADIHYYFVNEVDIVCLSTCQYWLEEVAMEYVLK